MADEIEKLLAQRLICRRDVKAEQSANGEYHPVKSPWTMDDLRNHVAGQKTFGHYLIDPETGMTKVFCFDLDVRKVRANDDPVRSWGDEEESRILAFNNGGDDHNKNGAIDIWQSELMTEQKKQIGIQLASLAEVLARKIVGSLGIPVAVAYSGSKGLHVYGLAAKAAGGPVPAADAYEGAHLVLGEIPELKSSHGSNFFRHTNPTFSAVEIEVFPKQPKVEADGYGNLLRLPCGINRKTNTFGYFMQFGPPAYEFHPMDTLRALDGEVPWAKM